MALVLWWSGWVFFLTYPKIGVHRSFAELRKCPTARVPSVQHTKVAPDLCKPLNSEHNLERLQPQLRFAPKEYACKDSCSPKLRLSSEPQQP